MLSVRSTQHSCVVSAICRQQLQPTRAKVVALLIWLLRFCARQVIVVNRLADPQLQQIEGEAIAALAAAAQFGDVQRQIQALAVFVAQQLGGPCSNEPALIDHYVAATAPLKHNKRSVVMDIGTLQLGASRHRALLFKALADAMGLPSAITKRFSETGVEGAGLVYVQLPAAQYEVDVMAAPGTLKPLKQGLEDIAPSE